MTQAHLPDDVPSPIDLRVMADAQEWEESALRKRPFRTDFFAEFAQQIQHAHHPVARVLELGSGPGFLAAHLLTQLPRIHMTLLDFSAAMHELAHNRLNDIGLLGRADFIERSFKEPDWTQGLGQFDAIVTNQAVHELRHKRYAVQLHRQARELLHPSGQYLVCDHYVGADGMTNDQLYMQIEEQKNALLEAGFSTVTQVLCKSGLVLHRAS